MGTKPSSGSLLKTSRQYVTTSSQRSWDLRCYRSSLTSVILPCRKKGAKTWRRRASREIHPASGCRGEETDTIPYFPTYCSSPGQVSKSSCQCQCQWTTRPVAAQSSGEDGTLQSLLSNSAVGTLNIFVIRYKLLSRKWNRQNT